MHKDPLNRSLYFDTAAEIGALRDTTELFKSMELYQDDEIISLEYINAPSGDPAEQTARIDYSDIVQTYRIVRFGHKFFEISAADMLRATIRVEAGKQPSLLMRIFARKAIQSAIEESIFDFRLKESDKFVARATAARRLADAMRDEFPELRNPDA